MRSYTRDQVIFALRIPQDQRDLWRSALSRLPSLTRADAAGAFGREVLERFWGGFRLGAGYRIVTPRERRWVRRLEAAGIVVRVDHTKQIASYRRTGMPLWPSVNNQCWELAPDLLGQIHRLDYVEFHGEAMAQRLFGPKSDCSSRSALIILARESDPGEPEMWRSLANGARLDIPLPAIAAMEAAGLIERLRCDGELVTATDGDGRSLVGDLGRGHARLTSAGWAEVAKR